MHVEVEAVLLRDLEAASLEEWKECHTKSRLTTETQCFIRFV